MLRRLWTNGRGFGRIYGSGFGAFHIPVNWPLLSPEKIQSELDTKLVSQLTLTVVMVTHKSAAAEFTNFVADMSPPSDSVVLRRNDRRGRMNAARRQSNHRPDLQTH